MAHRISTHVYLSAVTPAGSRSDGSRDGRLCRGIANPSSPLPPLIVRFRVAVVDWGRGAVPCDPAFAPSLGLTTQASGERLVFGAETGGGGRASRWRRRERRERWLMDVPYCYGDMRSGWMWGRRICASGGERLIRHHAGCYMLGVAVDGFWAGSADCGVCAEFFGGSATGGRG